MKVIHFRNIANVSYMLTYGLKKYYNIDASLVMLYNPPTKSSSKTLYGYDSGNPYGVKILYLKEELADVLKFSAFLLKEKVDIIHLHWVARTGVLGTGLAKLLRAKIVRHFHGSDLRPMNRWTKTLYSAIGEDLVLFSTNDLTYYLWPKALGHSKWLPNPVDPVMYKVSSQSTDDGSTIFFPTKHDEKTKKTSVAFRAWKILRQRNRKVKLKTIAWGRDLEYFYHKFGSDNRIEWLSVMTRQEYVRQLRSSSIIWGQFKLGELGLTELEAMAAAKPVITKVMHESNHFPPIPSYDNPRLIALASNELCCNYDKRKQLGLSLARWCKKYHDLKTVCSQLLDVYRSIMKPFF